MLDPWFRTAFPLRHARKAAYWKLIEHRVARDAAGIIFTSEEERRLGRGTFQPWDARREEVLPLGTIGILRPTPEMIWLGSPMTLTPTSASEAPSASKAMLLCAMD